MILLLAALLAMLLVAMAATAPVSPPPAPPSGADPPATPPASPPAITPPPAAEPERDDPRAKAKAKVAEAKAEAIAAVYMIPVFFLGLIPKAGEAIVAAVVFVAQVVVFVVKAAVVLIPQATLGVLIFCFSLTYLAHGVQALDEGTAVALHKTAIPFFADWGQYQETRRLTSAHLWGLLAFLLATIALEAMVFLACGEKPAGVGEMICWSAGLTVVGADVVLFWLGCHALGGTWFKASVFTVGYLAGMVMIALLSNFLIALLFHRRTES